MSQANQTEAPPRDGEEPSSGSGNAIASRYQTLLGTQPTEASNPVDADRAEPLTTTERSGSNESIRRKIDRLTDRAFAAEETGNTTLAERYFKICEGLSAPEIEPTSSKLWGPPSALNTKTTITPIPNPVRAPPPSNKTDATPGGVVFDDDARPTNHNVGFSPFFKKNLLELCWPLPLTIFNEVWQDKAIIHYNKKRSKADESNIDKDRYTGYPYPCEYTQTYAEWSINHQGFYAALIQIANYPKFAGWLLVHKRHCDQLVTQHGFMTGLRYDINVRTNAFAHRIEMPNGSTSITNISIYNDVIAQKIIARCRKFDKTDFTENPYIKGGARQKWDPVTGLDPSKADHQTTTNGSNPKGNGGQNQSAGKGQTNQHRAQSPQENRGSGSGRYPRTQGYKGN